MVLGSISEQEMKIRSKNRYCTSLKHGMFGSRIHKIWDGMIQRCHNTKSRDYKHWGNRGIFVCKEWREFISFYRDMGDPPIGMSIDRIDNNKGYFKENCRWATQTQQHRNKRNNRFFEYKGERKTMSEFIEISGINRATFQYRAQAGWTIDRILNTPIAATYKGNQYSKTKQPSLPR